jgi:hypothetical protein
MDKVRKPNIPIQSVQNIYEDVSSSDSDVECDVIIFFNVQWKPNSAYRMQDITSARLLTCPRYDITSKMFWTKYRRNYLPLDVVTGKHNLLHLREKGHVNCKMSAKQIYLHIQELN